MKRNALFPAFVLSSFLGVAVLIVSCACAQAAPSAREVLESEVTAILDIIRKPAYANPATRGPLRADLEREVRKGFDFDEFSSRTAGPRWQQFTAEQKRQFSNAFADLLINTYAGKISGYNGEKVAYTGERTSAKGDRAEVLTVVTLKDGKKVPVAYRLLPKDGTWKVYDVLIENISLVKNYRTQFQDILKNASPEDLIARIRAKADETAKK